VRVDKLLCSGCCELPDHLAMECEGNKRTDSLQEHELTEKQKEWLEASRKIGTWPLTKSERQTLERLYAEMPPREQQGLYEYIQETYRAKGKSAGAEDLLALMEKRQWHEPSQKLRNAFTKSQKIGRPPSHD